MIHVLIDTSIFRQDPWRSKPGFKAIERLAKTGNITLHIPQVVKQEFVSQQIETYEKDLSKISSGISDLQRKPLGEDINNRILDLSANFSDIQKMVLQFADDEFKEWANKHNAIFYPISESHGERVMQDYFIGNPPFKSKRSRSDIPDAFIWQVIVDLLKDIDELCVICGDEGLQDACKTDTKFATFKSIDDFISDDLVSPILREANATVNIEKIYNIFPSKLDVITSSLENLVDTGLYGKDIESQLIPSDGYVGQIQSVYTPDLVEVDLDEKKYYGNGIFVMPFKVFADADLTFAIFKGDYYAMGVERSNRFSVSDLNDHYFEAEKNYPIIITGTLSISVDIEEIEKDDVTEESLGKLIEDAEYDFNAIYNIEIDEDLFLRRFNGNIESSVMNSEDVARLIKAIESIINLKQLNDAIDSIKIMAKSDDALEAARSLLSNLQKVIRDNQPQYQENMDHKGEENSSEEQNRADGKGEGNQ